MIGSSLSQFDIHMSSGTVASDGDDDAALPAGGSMARSFSISVSLSSPKREATSKVPFNIGRLGEEVDTPTVVRRGDDAVSTMGVWSRAERSVSADEDDAEGDDADRRNGEDVERGVDGDGVEVMVLVDELPSRIDLSQSSVFACAGEMVLVLLTKVLLVLLAGAAKRPTAPLAPPAAGTSHRPMKGTRCTPPVLGGEWKTTPKRLPTE